MSVLEWSHDLDNVILVVLLKVLKIKKNKRVNYKTVL